jgi:predicted short-subunit dehydrogenase-like oxidoreductase (DUF2520 family)
LWHAAAVTTANGAAVLLALGEAMLREIGIARPEAVLDPLATGALANARERGAAATLTGPVVRGEVATVRGHIEALRVRAPNLLEAYRLVARTILLAAVDAGRLDNEAATAIRRELEG